MPFFFRGPGSMFNMILDLPRAPKYGPKLYFEQSTSVLVDRLKFMARKMRRNNEIHSHKVDKTSGCLKVYHKK